jgi:hypothetical protein
VDLRKGLVHEILEDQRARRARWRRFLGERGYVDDGDVFVGTVAGISVRLDPDIDLDAHLQARAAVSGRARLGLGARARAGVQRARAWLRWCVVELFMVAAVVALALGSVLNFVGGRNLTQVHVGEERHRRFRWRRTLEQHGFVTDGDFFEGTVGGVPVRVDPDVELDTHLEVQAAARPLTPPAVGKGDRAWDAAWLAPEMRALLEERLGPEARVTFRRGTVVVHLQRRPVREEDALAAAEVAAAIATSLGPRASAYRS